jgi:acyl carrier protein
MSDSETATQTQVELVVRRHLDAEGRLLQPSTRFVDDLGADSLALVQLTLALEEQFDIDIDGDDIRRLRTVQDAIDYVERCLADQFRFRAPAPGG